MFVSARLRWDGGYSITPPSPFPVPACQVRRKCVEYVLWDFVFLASQSNVSYVVAASLKIPRRPKADRAGYEVRKHESIKIFVT